jgi:hypothetical protein
MYLRFRSDYPSLGDQPKPRYRSMNRYPRDGFCYPDQKHDRYLSLEMGVKYMVVDLVNFALSIAICYRYRLVVLSLA